MFDMDGTLINGRTIFKIAEERNFKKELMEIIESKKDAYKKTIEIARLLKCMRTEEFLEIFKKIPIQKNADYVVKELKKMNIITAIVTDSYQIPAMYLQKKLGIDYVFSNKLLIENSHINGKVILHNKNPVKKFESCKIHSICKRDVLRYLCRELKIDSREVIAVGDGKVDICMIKESGLGIAFNGDEEVRKEADVSINELTEILKYAKDGVEHGYETGGSDNSP